jgi:ribosome-associated protein
MCDDKKAEDIILLNIKKLTAMADYFLILSALSVPHLRALTEMVRKDFREELGLETVHSEGRASAHWSVLDYGGLVIHVMTGQARQFYSLENIWDEGKKVKWTA